MKANLIRKTFLEFFRERGHTVVKSSPLIPHDDPSLLFTNAGMNQFKRVFLGEERRPYQRATSSQKCMRAGGKHNDLENVGYTARHHTFFEMLGNFSFGDYFKKEAIEYAWDFLTSVMNLPKERLYVTIHAGDKEMNLGPDEEARTYWSRFLPEDRILPFPTKDNFWSMGETGPCGPCSEILFDQGEALGCGKADCGPGCECDRYLELWNLVFMQFNRKDDGSLEPLPRPSIDTGMGLERIAAVVQKVPSNYETDLFAPLLEKIAKLSGYRYGEDADRDISMRVISDHARAATFLISDGVLPSNEGRGYVLRRVIRRALRHGQLLGLGNPFLHEVAISVMTVMQDAYPELLANKNYIVKVISQEEERFSETLNHGIRLLNSELEKLQKTGINTIPGELIFKLYDTYGFPIDIIIDVAKKQNLKVDEKGFNKLMEQQRARSRIHWRGSGERELSEAYRQLLTEGIKCEFVGYEQLEAHGKVLALIRNGQRIPVAKRGDSIDVITSKTPFYGEAGGQVGDRGIMIGPKGKLEVIDTLRLPGELIAHLAEVKEGSISEGETVKLTVDKSLRVATASNHTATHILHAVLRKVLGDHVRQAGSLVSPKRLRFDFTHFAALSASQIDSIEELVNREIRRNQPVLVRIMAFEEAIKTGAMALFEEKYGDRVRLVEIPGLSRELCGGTHASRTGDIGIFVICQESAIAAGVRRIEAITGEEAVNYIQEQRQILRKSAELLKTGPMDLLERLGSLLQQQRLMEKELEALRSALVAQRSEDLFEQCEEVEGVKVLVTRVEADSPKTLREINDRFKQRIANGVMLIGSVKDNKVLLLASVSKNLSDRIHAGELIKEIAKQVGGGGGGRADMAQAGGSRPEQLNEALRAGKKRIIELIREALGRA